MKLFIKVVELGSFTAAAKAFDIPRGKVSRKIAELECHLNATLFHRTTRTLSLTNSGDTYYVEIKKALDIIDNAALNIHSGNKSLSGKIKIGLLPETHELIHPIIFQFHDKYPDIELDIRTITNGFEDMFQQGLDIAFHGGRVHDSNLVAKKILTLERCLVASPVYLQENGYPQTLDDLRKHQCICYRWPSGEVDKQWQFTPKPIELNTKLICNSIGFIKSATMAGRGISLLPKLMIENELINNQLSIILPESSSVEEHGWLLYPQRNTLSTASLALIDWLKEEIPKLI